MIYRFLKKQKWISVLVTAVFFLQTLGGIAAAAPQEKTNNTKQIKTINETKQKTPGNKLKYLPNEVLVKYKAGTSQTLKSNAATNAGVQKTVESIGIKGKQEITRYKLKEGQSVQNAISNLKQDPNVVYAEPNYLRQSTAVATDPGFGEQWGLNNTGQTLNGGTITPGGTTDADIDAPEAWDLETGATNPVTVAVIDSGIDVNHPDLVGRTVAGKNFAGISQYANEMYATMNSLANPMAQSIRGNGQNLTDIMVMMSKNGSPTENVTVSVRNSLTGPDLASYTIVSSELSNDFNNPSTINKALNTPVALTDGVTYYIVVSTTNTAGNYELHFTDGNNYTPVKAKGPYVDGMLHRYNTGTSSWIDESSKDLFFKTNANNNPRDDNGHGTHVSGIIAASANNAIGIAGVAYGAKVKIMPIKAGDSSGALLSSDVISAINYAVTNGAKVINMSLGGAGSSTAEQDAITNAYNSGVVFFAAAGNDSNTKINYPAGYTHVIGVGATDRFDARASFSNYNSTVDISAPGDVILSTLPTYATNDDPNYTAGDYLYMSGTSQATPMAAGVAALMLSANPALTPDQIESIMEQTADDKGAPGRDDQFGYGRVNAQKAITYIKDITAPTGSVTINSGASVTNAQTVSLAISATDAAPATGVKDMWISNDGTAGNWEPYNTTKSWSLSSGDGSKTVYVKFRDVKGNESSVPYTANITLDTTAPTGGSVSINGTAASTASTTVTLNIAAIGADLMMIGNDANFTGGVWETYATTRPWTLPTGDGIKTVYVKFKDNAGNVSAVSTATILLDTPQPPTGSVAINGGAGYTNIPAVTLNISASGDAVQMWIANDPLFATGNWETYNSTKSWNLPAGDGTKTVYIKLRDSGNNEATYSDTIVFDTMKPAVTSVTINNGAASTASPVVTLNLNAMDVTSGIATMMISNDPSFSGAGWETYSASKLWTLTTGNGTKTVYVKFKDNAGNVTATYSPSIVLNVPVPPVPPAPPAQPSGPSYPGHYLQNGASGQDVSSIQEKLNSLGFNSGAVDGKFGPITLAAIKAFQRANGLVPDGIVGPLTWAKLFGGNASGNYIRLITYGIIDSSVASIQSKLAALGFNPGPIDGIFGSRTLDAVKSFQKARGLAVDGIVGPITWRALFG